MRATRTRPGQSPPHGSRARYIRGCHCAVCTEANTRYGQDYAAARRIEGRQTLLSQPVVAHLRALTQSGIELRAIARLTGFSVRHLRAVAQGECPRVTRRLNDAVLTVQPGDYSANARVPAAVAAELLDDLKAAGVGQQAVARAFGYRFPNFAVGRRRYVTQRTYRSLLVIAAAAGVRRRLDVLEVVA